MKPLELLDSRILIVDDQRPNVLLLEKILAAHGYQQLIGITDPREVDALQEQHDFDLILLDLNMPHRDGFEVIEALRRASPEDYPPILVLTAQSDQDSRLRALELGARDFLTKPFDYTEVLSRIRNLLEVRLLHKRVVQQNEELEERVRARTLELHDTRLEIIRRLGRAAEYRDNETGYHILRMSHYSALLARAAGMDAAECDMLLDASPMHDVGKIGIPDRILLKPGKLDADEWAIMKTHARIGAEILTGHDSPLMRLASLIAATHHEKWDGSGYPEGLAGEAIPLAGRVTAVCDVFDALTTVRPYKQAWPVEEAFAYLRDNAGMHFDPGLAALFCSLREEVLAIRSRFAEPV
jgi:putative two-component system response regulator